MRKMFIIRLLGEERKKKKKKTKKGKTKKKEKFRKRKSKRTVHAAPCVQSVAIIPSALAIEAARAYEFLASLGVFPLSTLLTVSFLLARHSSVDACD